jgi:hypothetical protein
MIGELFSGSERKPIGYILSNTKPLTGDNRYTGHKNVISLD